MDDPIQRAAAERPDVAHRMALSYLDTFRAMGSLLPAEARVLARQIPSVLECKRRGLRVISRTRRRELKAAASLLGGARKPVTAIPDRMLWVLDSLARLPGIKGKKSS